jgi:hypothetical protein
MIIHTYHEPLPGVDRSEITALWAESWRRHGWIPVVHDAFEAERHTQWRTFCRVIQELPTVNSRAYEEACWLRWLVAAQCGGFWCDDDLINTGFKPRHALAQYDGEHPFCAVHDGEFPNMGLLFGGRQVFEQFFVSRVLSGMVPLTTERGQRHTSDMFLWQALRAEGHVQDVREIMGTWGNPTPAEPKLVHCSYDATTGRGQDRLEVIRGLVKLEQKGPAAAEMNLESRNDYQAHL